MPREPWPRGEYPRLARYVDAEAFAGSGLVPAGILELRARWPQVVGELYESLRRCGLHYDYAPWSANHYLQVIREHAEVIRDARGTCLDVATLFAALCLAARKRPYLAVVHRAEPDDSAHALVLLGDKDPAEESFAPLSFDGGLATLRWPDLAHLVENEVLVAVDCTGLTHLAGRQAGSGSDSSSGQPSGADAAPGGGAGTLDFDQARQYAATHLREAAKIMVVDVVWAQQNVHPPDRTPRVGSLPTAPASPGDAAGGTSVSDSSDSSASRAFARLAEHSRRVAHEAGLLLDGPEAGGPALPDLYVTRDKVEQRLLDTCDESSTQVVVGEAGIGKTSLLWWLANRCEQAGRNWLLFRATDLTRGHAQAAGPAADRRAAVSLEELEHALLHRWGTAPTVVLVDTIDLLLGDADGQSDILQDLLAVARGAAAALVLTCREREYERFRRLQGSSEHRKVGLGPYSPSETVTAVRRHAAHFCVGTALDPEHVGERIMGAVARGLPLAHVVRRPLTLRMLFETERNVWLRWAGGVPVPEIDQELDVTDLLDRFWRLRVTTDSRVGVDGRSRDDRPADLSRTAHFAAVLMLALGRPGTPRGTLDSELARHSSEGASARADELGTLIGRAVLVQLGVLAEARIEFFHQTFFEYATARALLNAGSTLLDELAARVHRRADDLFLAAIAEQLLVLACRTATDAHRIDHVFSGLLAATEPGLRQLAIAAYAQARYRGPRTASAGRQLLQAAEDGLVKRFLTYLPRVRHADIGSVLDDLVVVWQRTDHTIRIDTLTCLARLGAFAPDQVHAFLDQHRRDIDWPDWFQGLSAAEARRRRDGPLNLVRALGPVDQRWASTHLRSIGTKVTAVDSAPERGVRTSHEALAVTLGAAASTLRDDRDLEPLLELVPLTVRVTHGATGELRQALAGIQLRIWHSQGIRLLGATDDVLAAYRPQEAVPRAGGDEAEDPGDGADPGGRAGLFRLARWWALAELAHQTDARTVEQVLGQLVSVCDRRVRFDAANHFLRRLIEGAHRPAVPGAPPPRSGPATAAARAICGRYLATPLPSPKSGPGPGAGPLIVLPGEFELCRAGLIAATLPAAEVAEIVPAAGESLSGDQVWLREDRLAAFTVSAALGGHERARAALDAWVGRSGDEDGSVQADSPRLRRILLYQMRTAALREVAALKYLVAEATRSGLVDDYLINALADRGGWRSKLPWTVTRRIAGLAADLVASPVPETRGAGYRLFASLTREPVVPASVTMTLVPGLRERSMPASTAALTVLEKILAHHPDLLAPAEVFEPVARELERLAKRGEAPSHRATDRARGCLRDLMCRCGPLAPRSSLRTTVDQARDLTIGPRDPATLGPLGTLIARVAEVDLRLSADLLIDASRAMHAIAGNGTGGDAGGEARERNSWRQRRAHLWRSPLLALVPALSLTDWRETLEELARLEESILMQVIDISVEHRPGSADIITQVLADAGASGRVMAVFRAAQQRRQRREGGSESWMEIFQMWTGSGRTKAGRMESGEAG